MFAMLLPLPPPNGFFGFFLSKFVSVFSNLSDGTESRCDCSGLVADCGMGHQLLLFFLFFSFLSSGTS